MIDFELSEDERLIEGTARDFAQRVLAPKAAARDREQTFPVEELRALGGLGLLCVNVPEALGGSAAGVVAYSLAMQEVARADASVAVAMSVTNMVAEIITAFGSDAQKHTHVTALSSGEHLCGAFALSEPQAGSDPAAMTTRARRDGDHWILDGAKQWISHGDRAGVIVVWAKSDLAASGTRGISAFLVERGAAGLHVGRHEDKMGLRGSTTVALTFEGCHAQLLGAPGDGFKIAMSALDGGRIGIASQAVGVARCALDAAVPYVKERKQFGKALAEFQNTQFRLADMATELDAARLLTLRAAWLKNARRPFVREASIAKLYASEMAGRVCDAAVQLLGGYGYTRDHVVERCLRDARVQRIYEGTSEIQRIVIAREHLKEKK